MFRKRYYKDAGDIASYTDQIKHAHLDEIVKCSSIITTNKMYTIPQICTLCAKNRPLSNGNNFVES